MLVETTLGTLDEAVHNLVDGVLRGRYRLGDFALQLEQFLEDVGLDQVGQQHGDFVDVGILDTLIQLYQYGSCAYIFGFTHSQLQEQGLNELVILGENLQHFLVTGQIDQHCQCIFRNWLNSTSVGMSLH
jgi:hypothetical protein